MNEENMRRKMAAEMFGEPIASYSREEAIADGDLHDVSEMAREAGFKYPVAVTSDVMAVIDSPTMPSWNDKAGRMWDLLFVLGVTIRSARMPGDTVSFAIDLAENVPGPPEGVESRTVRFESVVGPGDNLEPVITVFLAEGDSGR